MKDLEVVVQLVVLVLVLPASLNDDPGAEDQSHQEDGVPQLLQVLLQTPRDEQHDFIIRLMNRLPAHTSTALSHGDVL